MKCCIIGCINITEISKMLDLLQKTVEELISQAISEFYTGIEGYLNDIFEDAVKKSGGRLIYIHYGTGYEG